jgi:hypothetical protein
MAKKQDIQWLNFEDHLSNLHSNASNILYAATYNYEYTSGQLIKHTQIPTVYNKYKNISRRSRASSKFKDLPFYPYGPDNQYPQFLLDLIQKSTLHRTAWKSVSNFAYGNGWSYRGEGGQEFYEWAKSKGLTASFTLDLFKQVALFGGGYVKLNFINPKELNGTRIQTRKELYQISPQKFNEYRVGKEEDEGPYIDRVAYYWHHPDYGSDNFNKDFLQGIPRFFDFEDLQENGDRQVVGVSKDKGFWDTPILNQGRFIVPIGRPSATSGYYPSASYESNSTIDEILVDEALAAFDIAGLKNGLVASYIVTVPVSGLEKIRRNDPERYDEIIQKHQAKIANELEGAENNRRTLVFVQDVGTKDHKPAPIQITEVPHTNNSGIQDIISKRRTKTILAAWHIGDSRLVGTQPEAGQGFSNQSEMLKTSFDILFASLLTPDIIIPVEDFVNTILADIYRGETGREKTGQLYLLKANLFKSTPSENILRDILTLNELRSYYGFVPRDGEDYFLREHGVKDQFSNQTLDVEPTNDE